MRIVKPPRKKTEKKKPTARTINGNRTGKRKEPAAAERTEDASQSTGPEKPAEETGLSPGSHTITNQDEQEKITNAGEGELPIADK